MCADFFIHYNFINIYYIVIQLFNGMLRAYQSTLLQWYNDAVAEEFFSALKEE